MCPSFSDIVKRGSEAVVTLHNVGGPGEYGNARFYRSVY
jgi:hypothetical protein